MSEMVLPEGWDIKTLSDLGKCVRGLTYSPENVVQHGLLVLRSSNIQNGRLSFEDNVYVNLDVNEEFLSHVGDILICVRNGSKNLIGKSASITRECPKSTHGAFMTVFRSEHNVFVKHLINSEMFFSHLSRDIGATINSINNSNLLQYKFPIPPLSEQHTIASILTSVDEVIETTEAQIGKLQDLKKGMMQELLTKGIGHTEFKDSPVGRIPKEWGVRNLPAVCANHDSKRVPIKASDRASMKGKYPYYGASGAIDYVNDYIFDGEYILLGEDGENVISRNLPLAFIARGKYWVNNHAHVLKPKPGMEIGFLCEYLESLDYKNIASGSAQPKITQDSLNRIKVPVPPEAEQIAIGDCFRALDKLIGTRKQKLVQQRQMKAGLMQDLLTGKVRVKVN